ncbi:MAG: S1C family serine protease [Planctomycetaceae bacterium]|nr:S1C family serine protease [Planctomycetaceae bacterium]
MKVHLIMTGLAVALIAGDAAADDDVIASRQGAIVKLFGAGVGTLDSYGSGVLVSAEGHVVTVWNHLVNTGYLTAVASDGRRFDVEVVGTSLDHDLAVLKLQTIESDTFEFVDIKNASDAAAEAINGQSVLAFSNVFHVATGDEPVSVVHGVIACQAPLAAGLGQWEFPVKEPVYILDAITNNSGAAGGLLTDAGGRPLGLLGREIRHRETQMWVNYAVPWATLQPAVTAILSGQRVAASNTEEPDRLSVGHLTQRFGLTVIPGALERTPAFIDRIVPDSIADRAGLRRGDLIVLVDDRVIKSAKQLRVALASFRPRQKISITIDRGGRLEILSLRMPR